jgi:hypothetical protein
MAQIAALLLHFLPITAWADVLVLKNGGTMEGVIISETPEEISIDIGEGKVALPRSAVESVTRSKDRAELMRQIQIRQLESGSESPEGTEFLRNAYQAAARARENARKHAAEIAEWHKAHPGEFLSEQEKVAREFGSDESFYYKTVLDLKTALGWQRRTVAVAEYVGLIESRLKSMEAEFTSTTIHVSSRAHCYLIPVVVNGKVKTRFALDHGRNVSLITPRLARELGLEYKEPARQILLDSLELGGRLFYGVRAAVEDSDNFQGMIGTDLIRRAGIKAGAGGAVTFTRLK